MSIIPALIGQTVIVLFERTATRNGYISNSHQKKFTDPVTDFILPRTVIRLILIHGRIPTYSVILNPWNSCPNCNKPSHKLKYSLSILCSSPCGGLNCNNFISSWTADRVCSVIELCFTEWCSFDWSGIIAFILNIKEFMSFSAWVSQDTVHTTPQCAFRFVLILFLRYGIYHMGSFIEKPWCDSTFWSEWAKRIFWGRNPTVGFRLGSALDGLRAS